MSETIDFNNPAFPVKLPKGQKPEYLMVLLHGYGSDGDDLITLSQLFASTIPNAVYIAPHAPTPTGFGGYQWFPLTDLSDRELETGTISIAPHIHNIINQALAHYDIAPAKLILAGFSQGAMNVLHIAPEREVAPLAVIAYSGALTAVNGLKDRIKSKPPILLCHGGSDPIVAPNYSRQAEKILKEHGFDAQALIFSGYVHTIPPEAMKKSLDFLNIHIKAISRS